MGTETLTVSDSPLPSVIAYDEASGHEPLELGVAQPADVDTHVMGRNVEEVFSAQDREPVSDEHADLVFADPETLGGEPIDFASASP